MKQIIPAAYRRYIQDRQHILLQQVEGRSGLSWRGLWVGIALSFLLAIGAPYANMAMRATTMAFDFNTPGAIFLFFVLIGGLNFLFKVASRDLRLTLGLGLLAPTAFLLYYLMQPSIEIHNPGFWFTAFLAISALINIPVTWRQGTLALNRSELILVYIMLLVVSALCTMGMTQQLLPTITALFYYASPENKWLEKLSPHFPHRSVLVNDGNENKGFYEGAALDQIPYAAWVEPLFWWGLFLLALYIVMVASAVILRRQWMERERLAYPLTQVGIAMVAGEEKDSLVNGFLKSRAMWSGMALPFIFGSLKALNHYDPAIPSFNLLWNTSLLGFQWLELRISFALIGFSYLINTQVAASIWIFHLLSKVENEVFGLMGLQTASHSKFVYGVSYQPLLAYQCGGALIAMVLLGFWTGRAHFKEVFAKAFGRAPQVDDSDEIMSYRSAVIGLLGGCAVMLWWLWFMGTKLWVALIFLIAALLIFVGIARVVAEAGLAAIRSPMIAPDLVIQGLGANLVGASGVFNLSLAYIWAADIRVFLLALLANGLKLIEGMDRAGRRLIFWAVVLAILIGVVGSCWMVFHLAYLHGGINLDGWRFKGGPETIFNNAVRQLKDQGVDWWGLGFFSGGGIVMLLLSWARLHLPWWPLHPLGFPIGANFMMNKAWFSVFIAWAIKSTILRYGGAALYNRTQRFFLGLITGEVLCNGLWIVIDYFTGKMGNMIFMLG